MKRPWLAPEVIQSSAMDCGPAALACLFRGLGIGVRYGDLRTACATDVDGTSIDTLELLANAHGLRAEQVMLPLDHLPLPHAVALPAVIVTRQPLGGTHFVVVWSATRSFVQLMDPSVGRRVVRWERFREEIYVHEAAVPLPAWRAWAGSESFLGPLRQRLRALSIPSAELLTRALAEPNPQLLMHLDAATRMVATLCRSGAVRAGAQSTVLLNALLTEAGASAPGSGPAIPAEFYTARLAEAQDGEEAQVLSRGAVLVQILGRTVAGAEPAAEAPARTSAAPHRDPVSAERHPLRLLWEQLGTSGRGATLLLAAGGLLSALGASVEPLVLRALLDAVPQLGLPMQRLAALLPCLLIFVALLCADALLFTAALRTGRRIELQLRAQLHARLPLLGEVYFSSRPVSDLADRSHQIHRLRDIPLLLVLVGRALAQIAFTAVVLCWLDPHGAPLTALLAGLVVMVPILIQPLLLERDLRARSHQGALMRFHLDTLLGAMPVRAHGAEAALRTAHEDLLAEWAAARRSLGRAVLLLCGSQGLLCLGATALLWLSYLGRHRDPSGLLLLAYLSLSLPTLGQTLALGLRQYPGLRSTLLRLLEPLQAPLASAPRAAGEERAPHAGDAAAPTAAGVEVRLTGVAVRAAGQSILQEVNLHIPAGTHVAVVGVSGSGKSTLLALLLGFHQAAAGRVQVDGAELTEDTLDRLRRQTSWVDPAVQLHNRSLLANLNYGNGDRQSALSEVLALAELEGLVARMPQGMQTVLGEGGALLSGGEGQRVRLGRALGRPEPRLVLLDEPFRGLHRADRQELLRRTRLRCRGATLLCVTHDIGETLDFERVLVLHEGRIVEAGVPAELAGQANSRYRALLDAENSAQLQVWRPLRGRRVRLHDGQLREEL